MKEEPWGRHVAMATRCLSRRQDSWARGRATTFYHVPHSRTANRSLDHGPVYEHPVAQDWIYCFLLAHLPERIIDQGQQGVVWWLTR